MMLRRVARGLMRMCDGQIRGLRVSFSTVSTTPVQQNADSEAALEERELKHALEKEIKIHRSKMILLKNHFTGKIKNQRPKESVLEQALTIYNTLRKKQAQDLDSERKIVVSMLKGFISSGKLPDISEEGLADFISSNLRERTILDFKNILNIYFLKTTSYRKHVLNVAREIVNYPELFDPKILPEDTILKISTLLLEHEKNSQIIETLVREVASKYSESSPIFIRKFRYLLQENLLLKCWDPMLAEHLFMKGLLPYKLFRFHIEEQDPAEWFAQFTKNNGLSPQEMDKLIEKNRLGFVIGRVEKGGIGREVIQRIESGKETSSIVANLKISASNNELATILANPRLFLEHLTAAYKLRIKDITQPWERQKGGLSNFARELNQDFQTLVECTGSFFQEKQVVEDLFNQFKESLEKLITETMTPQHLDDTKLKVWSRSLREISFLVKQLVHLRDLSDADTDSIEFPWYLSAVSKILCDALTNPIMHPEFDQDLENYMIFSTKDDKYSGAVSNIVNKRQSDHDKARKAGQPIPKVESKKNESKITNISESVDLWKQQETVFRVNEEFILNCSGTIINHFLSAANDLIDTNLVTKQFIMAWQLVIEARMEKLSPVELAQQIKNVADCGFINSKLKKRIESDILEKIDTFLPKLKAACKPEVYTDLVITIAYYCTLNKNYNQTLWNELIDNIDVDFITNKFETLDKQMLILLGQIILLTRMEAPYVRSGGFDRIMPLLTTLNQAEFKLFAPSKFSETVTALLKKFYYDFLRVGEVAELFPVHLLQNTHVVLCLNESHFLGGSGIPKGRVQLAVRILQGLKYTVHFISKRKYRTDEKRSSRLQYLRENLQGIEINEKRRVEVETTPAHNY